MQLAQKLCALFSKAFFIFFLPFCKIYLVIFKWPSKFVKWLGHGSHAPEESESQAVHGSNKNYWQLI